MKTNPPFEFVKPSRAIVAERTRYLDACRFRSAAEFHFDEIDGKPVLYRRNIVRPSSGATRGDWSWHPGRQERVIAILAAMRSAPEVPE